LLVFIRNQISLIRFSKPHKEKFMTQKPQASVEMPKDTPQKVESSQEAGKQASASNKWTAVQRIRMPHRVGMPLGCSSCGDQIER
jgi:hypothetical protein